MTFLDGSIEDVRCRTMRVSELIKHLKALKDEHGDLPVVHSGSGGESNSNVVADHVCTYDDHGCENAKPTHIFIH